MQLSPKIRLVIGVLSVGVSALSGALAAYDVIVPAVGISIAVLTPMLNFLLAPSGLGGTQQGLVSPTLSQPPPADVEGPAPVLEGMDPVSPSSDPFSQAQRRGPSRDPYFSFWPVAALPYLIAAERGDADTGQILLILCLVFVIACLFGAFYLIFRLHQTFEGIALAVVGLIAAVICFAV